VHPGSRPGTATGVGFIAPAVSLFPSDISFHLRGSKEFFDSHARIQVGDSVKTKERIKLGFILLTARLFLPGSC